MEKKKIEKPEKINLNDKKNTKRIKKQKENIYKDKINELSDEVELYKNQLLRKAAELENFKKRTEKQICAIINNASEEIIKEILPIIDDFDRTLDGIKKMKGNESVFSAVEMIHNKMIKKFENRGLKHINAVGKEFNTDYHEAMMVKKDKKKSSNIVLEEFEKGYILNDKVIRHSKVVVNK